jgi:hypothetical protein
MFTEIDIIIYWETGLLNLYSSKSVFILEGSGLDNTVLLERH